MLSNESSTNCTVRNLEKTETIKRYNGRLFCCACEGLCGELADFEVQGWYFCHYHLAEMFRDFVAEFGYEVPEKFVEKFVSKPQI